MDPWITSQVLMDMFFIDKNGDTNKDISEKVWLDDDDENLLISTSNNIRSETKISEECKDDKYLSGAEYSNRLRMKKENLCPTPNWSFKRHIPKDESVINSLVFWNSLSAFGQEIKIKLVRSMKLAVKLSSLQFHPKNDHIFMIIDIKGELFIHSFEEESRFVEECISKVDLNRRIIKAFFTGKDAKIMIHTNSGIQLYDYKSESIRILNKFLPKRENHSSNFNIAQSSLLCNDQLLCFLDKEGCVHIFCLKTFILIRELKVNTRIQAICFSATDQHLFMVSIENIVYRLQLSNWKFEAIIHENLGDKITFIASHSNSIFLGSELGILTIYSSSDAKNNTFEKEKVLDNLNTSIESIIVSNSGSLLAYYSRKTKNSLRIMHLPSRKILSDFSKIYNRIGKVINVSFSSNDKMVAISNSNGKIMLFEIKISSS